MITEQPLSARYQLLSTVSRAPAWPRDGLPAAGFLLAVHACRHRKPPPTPSELLDAGRADDALRLLTPQATGNNAAAFNYLCRVYFALADWDNAVRNCERAAQIEPGNAIFQLWLGRSYGEKANVSANPLTAYSLARKTVAAFITAHARSTAATSPSPAISPNTMLRRPPSLAAAATKLWPWLPNSPPSIHPMPPGYVPWSPPMQSKL